MQFAICRFWCQHKQFLCHYNCTRFNNSLRLFNRWILAILSFWQLQWAKTKDFLPVKREKIKHQNWVHLYRPCTSVALSNCVTRSVNNSKSTLDSPNGCQLSVFVDGCLLCQTYQCLCVARQIIFGSNWFKKVGKKKGWGGTLRENKGFFGYIYSFSSKKFGYFKLKQYLCTTRTRQASQRCSNVRVVLFLYNEQQNFIPEAVHQCARPCQSLAVKRLDSNRYSKGRELSRIYRLLPSISLYVSFITVAKGATSL